MEIVDPFSHSIQWSRRFIGLKLYLPMLVFGWNGYAEVIRHQIKIGDYLKQRLQERGWLVKNSSALPIACFTDSKHVEDEGFVMKVCDKIIKSGKSWISVYKMGKTNTLRACITNYNTSEEDIEALIMLLEGARREV
jgi:aromatic-L-amino-acid/L-tryptophan decarboxylase